VTTGLLRSADALAFGGLLGMLIAIFAGWLGGLLAPTQVVAAVPVAPVAPVASDRTEPVVVEPARPRVGRRPFRLLPSAGRKGGERVVAERVEPE